MAVADTTYAVEGIFVGGEAILPEEGHRTGIYKKPLADCIYLSREGLEGDVQSIAVPGRTRASLAKKIPR